MPDKDCRRDNSWPEDQPDRVRPNQNGNNGDDDDDDEEDLFQDEIWERINAQSVPHALDDGDDYILLNQVDQNHGGQQRLYQHNYQVHWINTDQPLFDNHGSSEPSNNETGGTDQSDILPADQSGDDDNVSQQQGTSSSTKQTEDPLDKEKIDVIKNLMSNFKLPDENFPSWAREVPEEEWKKCLDKKLNHTS